MKTKLLRKIRRRFGYYFNKDGWPVLVDHYQQKVEVINADVVFQYAEVKSLAEFNERMQVDIKQYAWRLFQVKIGLPFNVNLLQRMMYRKACRYIDRPTKYNVKHHDEPDKKAL